MNNIFEFRKRLVEGYRRFSSSFAHPRACDIAACLERAHRDSRFCPEALIQINPSYKRCDDIRILADKGIVTRKCAEIFRLPISKAGGSVPITLYQHQQDALGMVKAGKSFIVTTGTGSGKSLAFFIPIIDRILREKKPGDGPRIRAIVVYPMNALANSQLEEINKFLRGDPAVTVKRYTGQESGDDRRQLRESPPDVLLTNYVMLDLILTRSHVDREILQAARGLEFLVLDELHTYRGRQGADIAMLVRRLRTQLEADGLICIGTSATMANVGSPEDRRTAVARVAAKLFDDTKISPENVIMEVLEYVTGDLKDDRLKTLLPARVRNRNGGSWTSLEEFRNDPLAVWTERNLGIKVDQDGKTLVRAPSMTLAKAAEILAADADVTQDAARQALEGFLVAMYRKGDWEGGQPPFAFKLHQFLSGPGQLLVSLEPTGRRSVELDAQRFAPGGQAAGRLLYSAHFCRFCGQEYLPVWLEKTGDGRTIVSPRDIREEKADDEAKDSGTRAGFLCPAESLDARSAFNVPPDCTEEQKYDCLPDSWFTTGPQGERIPTRSCRDRIPEPLSVAPDGTVDPGGNRFWFLPGRHVFCLQCGQFYDSSLGKDSNRLVSLSGEGRSSATTALTFSALEMMYEERSDRPSQEMMCKERSGRPSDKLLGFTDNRQDAALQAGHFNEFVFMALLRSALFRALRLASGHVLGAAEVAGEVFKALGFEDGDPEMLANYLVDPRIRGVQLVHSQEAVRFMLGYRLFEDLGREWRFNNPNLEQLGIVGIEYLEIGSLSRDEELFREDPLLMSLTPEKRRQFAQIVFDFLRQSCCIRTRYFDSYEQDKARNLGANTLLENWRMPERDGESLAFSKSLVIYRDRKTSLSQNRHCKEAAERLEHNSAVKGSLGTKFLKLLIHGDIGGGHSLWEGTRYTEAGKHRDFNADRHDRTILLQAAAAMLGAARKYGIVDCTGIGSPEDPVTTCVLLDNAILWRLKEPAPAPAPAPVDAPAPAPAPAGAIDNEFFRNLYERTAEQLGSAGSGIYSYEAQEHTAQVDAEYREVLECRFRDTKDDRDRFEEKYPGVPYRRLPVLYCSPTMELGVDISTLDMVYLRNVPPTPANYAQRSGRAGRSGQAALVVTYCTALNPHDQWFFNDHVQDMVHGEVCVPSLDLTNQDLVESHLRAAWLSCVGIELPSSIDGLLDMTRKDTLPLKEEFRQALEDPGTREEAVRLVGGIMRRLLAGEFRGRIPPWYGEGFEERVVDEAPRVFDRALDRWRHLYISTQAQGDRAHVLAMSPNISKEDRARADAMHHDASRQLEELTCAGSRSGSRNNDFYLYRYLASEGVLPGYSFPRLPVTAWIQKGNAVKRKLGSREAGLGALISRPRFLALSEFGPMSLIYHEGHTFTVFRVKLRASDATGGGEVATTSARICPRCGRGHFGEENGEGVTNCKGCNAPLKSSTVVRNLYQVEAVEARPATRISLRDEERQRKGYDILSTYGFEHAPQILEVWSGGRRLLHLEYSPAARIQKINRGWRRRSNPSDYGFWMDPVKGDWVGEERSAGGRTADGAARPVRIVPYVQDHRNALVVTPDEGLGLDSGGLCTLAAALLRGVEHVFQLEPGEIAAEPIPEIQTARTLLLYEAAEGGAGVLGQLVNSDDRASILREIAVRALETMHYHQDQASGDWTEDEGHCEAGCYKCLLSYFNQPQHGIIDRRGPKALAILKALAGLDDRDLRTGAPGTDPGPDGGDGRRRLLRGLLAEHGFDRPDPVPRSLLAAGLDPDAWYQAARTACFFDAPSPEARGHCGERGISVLRFPSADPGELLQFLSAHPGVFGASAGQEPPLR